MKKLTYLIGVVILILGCETITGPLEDRIDDLEAQTEFLQEQIDSLRVLSATVLELQTQTQSLQDQIDSLQQELQSGQQTLQDQIDSLEQELQAGNQTLQDQIDSLQLAQNNLFGMVASIDMQIANLTSELTLLSEDVDSTDAELLAMIQALQAELADLNSQLSELMNELGNLAVTVTGTISLNDYHNEDNFIWFEDEHITENSHVEVALRLDQTSDWSPYTDIYLQFDSGSIPAGWYYYTLVGYGYVLFKDIEYGDKAGWEYRLTIFTPI